MRKILNMLLPLVIISGLVTNCDSFKTKKKNKKAEQTMMALNGEWQMNCQKQDWFDFTQVKESYTFSALGDFEKKIEIYKDECQKAEHTIEISGTYDSLGKAPDGVNATDINFTVSSANMTPNSEETAKLLNEMKYCSIEDWAINKKVDILNKDCAGTNYKNGDVVLDLYRHDGNQLHFGSRAFSFIGESSASRPDKIDDSRTFIKTK